MGLFSSSKSLSKEKFDHLLRDIDILSSEEREYVKAVFSKFTSGGISKDEAARAIREIQTNYKDNLESLEVQRVKEKIFAFFDE